MGKIRKGLKNQRLSLENERLLNSLRESEAKLKEVKQKLHRINKMRLEFVSTVSHELAGHMGSIREGISLMLDGVLGEINKKQEEFLSVILEDSDRLSRVTNRILNLSTVESGKIELIKKLVNVKDFIDRLISSFYSSAKNKKISLEKEFPPEDIYIFIDEDMIGQVISNLIINALKFTREGGKITVGIRDKENEVEINVRDTGIGIAKENIPNLFSKFEQFNEVRGHRKKGTGLGLAISKGMVELHKGYIRVESALEKGSKFIFTLPKLNGGVVLKEFVDNSIKRVRKNKAKFSLIIVSINDFQEVLQRFGKEKILAFIKGLETNVTRVLRGRNHTLRDIGKITIFLMSADKEGVLVVKNRIEPIIKEYLDKENLIKNVRLNLGMATFPDEAKTSKKLINKAYEPR